MENRPVRLEEQPGYPQNLVEVVALRLILGYTGAVVSEAKDSHIRIVECERE